jgi:orotidine-5'-phosphate decarboxylase
MKTNTQLIVALDVNTPEEGLALVDRIGDACTWYKVGKQLFTRYGPDIVRQLKERGKKVFLDLKFHDIPNTVREAVRSAAAIGADMTNVHASGGAAMLAAAAEGAKESDVLLIAVTVLTSMDEQELAGVGIAASPRDQVVRLAQLTEANGVPGVVCSALEIGPLREACGPDFVLVVPGIRPAGSSADDQKRVMTPGQAAELGANFIVVGRPIRCAEDPAAAARSVVAELA